VKTRNVTLSIPEDLLRQLKISAAKQETSLSAYSEDFRSRFRDFADHCSVIGDAVRGRTRPSRQIKQKQAKNDDDDGLPLFTWSDRILVGMLIGPTSES